MEGSARWYLEGSQCLGVAPVSLGVALVALLCFSAPLGASRPLLSGSATRAAAGAPAEPLLRLGKEGSAFYTHCFGPASR